MVRSEKSIKRVVCVGIGKVNFEEGDIEANLKAILEELKVFGKTNNLKGNYNEI